MAETPCWRPMVFEKRSISEWVIRAKKHTIFLAKDLQQIVHLEMCVYTGKVFCAFHRF